MAFIDVIKYEGTNDVLVFKHPIEDFNTKARLIVHKGQEAIVFMDGEARKLYTEGTYELSSKNLPGLKHIVALFSGGELANHCEVYYVNKLLFKNIPWIMSGVDIQDQTIENYFSFRAEGTFDVQVGNSLDLFNIIGNGELLTVDGVKEYFRGEIDATVKEIVSIAMNQRGISYGEINSHRTELEQMILKKMEPTFREVGLVLRRFYLSVNMEKDAIYDEHREHLGNRKGDQIEGSTYDKRRMYDVMETQAANQGGSGVAASAVSGMGFGVGMGQVYGGMVGNAVNSAFGGQQMYGGNLNNIQDNTAGIVQPHPVEKVNVTSSECRNCHKQIKVEWKCCPYCGTRTEIVRTCSKCGEVLPEGAQFCPTCSTKIN